MSVFRRGSSSCVVHYGVSILRDIECPFGFRFEERQCWGAGGLAAAWPAPCRLVGWLVGPSVGRSMGWSVAAFFLLGEEGGSRNYCVSVVFFFVRDPVAQLLTSKKVKGDRRKQTTVQVTRVSFSRHFLLNPCRPVCCLVVWSVGWLDVCMVGWSVGGSLG